MSVLSKRTVEEAFGLPSIEQLQQAMAVINAETEGEEVIEVDSDYSIEDPTMPYVPSEEEIRNALQTAQNMRTQLVQIPDVSEKEAEIDAIAESASGYFEDIMDKAFNAEDRFAPELFNAANSLLKTALDGKTAIINAKLKLLDLELKKQKLDAELRKIQPQQGGTAKDVNGVTITNRNQLLRRSNK